jgi:hypothetical protein
MINYSIPKPHALCGHFIKINSKSEYNQMREIAEGCGFLVDDYDRHNPCYQFTNLMRCDSFLEDTMAGQEITLDELRELAELSKITLPCEMEVRHCEKLFPVKQVVIDFYKGQAVVKVNDIGNFLTYAHFRLPNHRAGEIKAKIKEHQEAIDKLNKELEGIK